MSSVAVASQKSSWSWFGSDTQSGEIQQLTRKLEAAEAKLEAISKSNGTIEFSMDGTILEVNDNFLATMGYTRKEVIGKHHSMFVAEDYVNSPAYHEFWNQLRSGRYFSDRFLRIGKDGKEVYIRATYNPVFNEDGVPVSVVKVAIDVTAEVENMEEALRLQGVVDALPTNLIFADSDLVIRYMNPASLASMQKIAHLLPVAPNKVVGSSIDIFHKNPQYQRNILSSPANLPVKSMITLGDEILELQVHSISNRSGNMIGVMATWTIMTEQARIRTQVGKLNEVGQGVASSVQDMGAAITEITQNITRTANLSNDAETQSKQAGKSIDTLGECSAEIDDVVTLIRDLAEQTNLLALNATIEAARAGEAGRGFAVVASEVKALATGTRSATETIAERVERIRATIKDVIEATNGIGKSVSEVNSNTTQVAAAIEEQSAIISSLGTTADLLVNLSDELAKL
ncbi:methyl-accepting chemotaxis protein [Bremerella cremea]|uniref:methyl-accepting chemotaxis protein n=1 Tax=Bremerella cremea TaxID=1031537 RepID=UPI0031EB514A